MTRRAAGYDAEQPFAAPRGERIEALCRRIGRAQAELILEQRAQFRRDTIGRLSD